MNQEVQKLDRSSFFDELLHYATAYQKLTVQFEKTVAADEERLTENMLTLRDETIRKIEELEASHPDYISDAKDSDQTEIEKRRTIANIFSECAEIENRLLPLVQEKMKSLQEQARKIKSGRKALQGYGTANKSLQHAVYIEEKK